ncbi:MAG: hypothetical protein WCC01_12285 [Acidimicrobiia bacterium]
MTTTTADQASATTAATASTTSAPTTTSAPPATTTTVSLVPGSEAPAALQALQPIAVTNNGKLMTIDFEGDARALVEGEAHYVIITAKASEGGARFTLTLMSKDGNARDSGHTFDDADAVPSEDGGEPTIAGKPVESLWEWSTANQVVVRMVANAGGTIPTTLPSITVNAQESATSDTFVWTSTS